MRFIIMLHGFQNADILEQKMTIFIKFVRTSHNLRNFRIGEINFLQISRTNEYHGNIK